MLAPDTLEVSHERPLGQFGRQEPPAMENPDGQQNAT